MNKSWEIFIKKAKEFNINLTDKQVEQFKEYWQFLYEYNRHTNLVSSAELDVALSKHFADSLSIGLLEKDLDLNSPKTILDIGIGGGFPGFPIIIAYPELKLCAVDSVGKKTDFISKLSEELGLNDRIKVINSRAEDFAIPIDCHVGAKATPRNDSLFDFAVSRAVSRLNVLLEYTLPFVKVGGFFIAYKAKTFQEEIEEAKQALSILGGEVVKIANYTLSDRPGEDLNVNQKDLVTGETRKLILIKKIKPTPEKYPRRTGIPAKNPL